MTRWPDETPDVDEAEDDWMEREDEFARGHCRRCGLEGHRDEACPTVTPMLLKREL